MYKQGTSVSRKSQSACTSVATCKPIRLISVAIPEDMHSQDCKHSSHREIDLKEAKV